MTSHLRRTVIFVGVILALGYVAATATRSETISHESLGSSALSSIATTVKDEIDAGHIPGAVVVVGEQGHVVYRRAFGNQAVVPERVAMTVDTVFDLASLTKVVATTTAVMQLVEMGRIHLNDPVAKYWPAFAANGKSKITVEQLLTHTSGLRPDLDGAGWSGEAAAFARVAAEHPIDPPGTRFVYSDINFIALGWLVEKISGEPLDAYVRHHIFEPLKMTNTGFRPSEAERPRIAPADFESGELRWGEVQDPTAHLMGGVAGHAGLFSTADDLSRFAEMLLANGAADGKRILSAKSVALMTRPHQLPDGVRHGLGWDSDSPYTSDMSKAFGPDTYGHTGYTGTSLWIDPKTHSFLIVLTSRLHPDGHGDVRQLRQRLARIVAAADRPTVLTGIDVLAAEKFAPLSGKRVGLLTNNAGRDANGERTIDRLANATEVRLVEILTPEHGIDADREGKIASGIDTKTGIPIYSLYGETRRPSPNALAHIDALVIDLQDVGVRFYTYAATMAYTMEAASKAHIPVFVLDRPNPINADIVRGPVLKPDHPSFTSYYPMPVQHGMTMGELAGLFNGENGIGADLTVVRMQGYRRNQWFDETGLTWVNPSPNLRSLTQTILYPGVALIEGANVSVGRGTSEPFELVGAPWIDSKQLARYLTARVLSGVRFTPADFTPSKDPYAHQICHGVRIALTDRTTLDAPRLGIEIAAALHHFYPERFQLEHTAGMIGSAKVILAISNGEDPRAVTNEWNTDIASFKLIRSKYLLYPYSANSDHKHAH